MRFLSVLALALAVGLAVAAPWGDDSWGQDSDSWGQDSWEQDQHETFAPNSWEQDSWGQDSWENPSSEQSWERSQESNQQDSWGQDSWENQQSESNSWEQQSSEAAPEPEVEPAVDPAPEAPEAPEAAPVDPAPAPEAAPAAPVDAAPAPEAAPAPIQKRSVFDNVLGKLDSVYTAALGTFQTELPKLKELADKVANGQQVAYIKQLVQTGAHKALAKICGISVAQQISYVATACQALQSAGVPAAPVDAAPAPIQKRSVFDNVLGKLDGVYNTVLGKFQTELPKLKELADKVANGQQVAYIKQLVQTGAHKALAKVCGISVAQKISFVATACQALESAGVPAAPAPVDVAPVPEAPADDAHPVQKRGFNIGQLLQNAGDALLTGPLAQYKAEIEGAKTIATLIQQKKSPQEIIQAVLNLHLEGKIADLCKISLVQTIAPVKQTCDTVVPLLNSAATLAQFAPGLLG